MQRKYYSGIGLLAGLLAIAMMTLISTSADARSSATRGPAAVSQGSASKALVSDPSGTAGQIKKCGQRGQVSVTSGGNWPSLILTNSSSLTSEFFWIFACASSHGVTVPSAR